MIGARHVLLVGALAIAGCGGDGPDSPDGADVTADTTVEPAVERAAAIAAAIDVRSDGCGPRVGFGTGSVIAEDVVVTAAHVGAGATAVELIDSDGSSAAGVVVLFDPDLDLAVIRAESPIGTPLAPRPREAAEGEAGIVVLPRLAEDEMLVEVANITVVREAVIRTTDIYLEDPVRRDGFEVEGSVDPGDSGAMVVLPGGGAGIVWARSNVNERRAWAIDLPSDVLDGTAAGLTAPVDLGPCIR
ncbi:MAG: trypsin-like peptidase domain-containing protein [Ilumatobacteraceae bacterium]